MIHATSTHGEGAAREREYLAGWQRARAELMNLRKRLRSERVEMLNQAQRQAVGSFLNLADHVQAALTRVPARLQSDAWVQGVVHVLRQFEQLLKEYGVEAINGANEPFDPARHEAVAQVVQPGRAHHTVVEVVQPGYAIGGAVVRPAKVKVSVEQHTAS